VREARLDDDERSEGADEREGNGRRTEASRRLDSTGRSVVPISWEKMMARRVKLKGAPDGDPPHPERRGSSGRARETRRRFLNAATRASKDGEEKEEAGRPSSR
jgi:hypothetical protein